MLTNYKLKVYFIHYLFLFLSIYYEIQILNGTFA